MSTVEDFLSATEEQEIVKAIYTAEKETSGEIRVHIEQAENSDAFSRAYEVFHLLKMDNTQARNGVLIYVAVNTKKFVIYGDKGIDAVVPDDFWETTKNSIQAHFKAGNYKQGLIDGVLQAGKQLSAHFPWTHGDVDELPNEISKG